MLILKALMHEVWLWELRLDDEERSEQGQYRPMRVDGPSADGDQAAAGAVGPSEEPQERSPLSQEIENSPEEVEGKYGVEPAVAVPESIAPAIDHVQQDMLTANLTKKKAILEEELLPCHYFDFVYGTSTGGLIATILGRLRMTVTEGLELYRKVGDDLFGKRKSNVPLKTKYHHEPLERAVRDIVGSRCHEHPNCDGNDLHPWELDDADDFDVMKPRVCQSCCLTATHDENVTEAYLLRSYRHYYSENAPLHYITRYNEGADELPIWQVTRATTAAPFYFEMIAAEVNGTKKAFKDGGIRENNPSGAALSEFHALYEGKVEAPALMLSIGTGRPDTTHDGFASAPPGPFGRLPFVSKFLEKRAIISNLLIKYTEGEKQHKQMREYARGEHTWYKRLNVSEGLETMALDDWVKGEWQGQPNIAGGSSLTRMEEATTKYLERDFDDKIDAYAPPETMLEQAAEKLVRQRRARERMGGLRWDTFIGKYLHQSRNEANGSAG